jgi:hypothetical protein
VMDRLVEKPDHARALQLVTEYGPDRLRLLEGRFRLPTAFVSALHAGRLDDGAGGEPRLSSAVAAWAARRTVRVATTATGVVDLGVPPVPIG